MSRRHSQDRSLAPALEADPEAVGHLATLDDVPGDASRPALPWWFATPMPEPWDTYLWHQWPSAWAEITLRVCGSVWRTTGARMYAVHRDSELRADLYDWLIVTAVEVSSPTLGEFDAWHAGKTLAQFEALWSGQTLAAFDSNPLSR